MSRNLSIEELFINDFKKCLKEETINNLEHLKNRLSYDDYQYKTGYISGLDYSIALAEKLLKAYFPNE